MKRIVLGLLLTALLALVAVAADFDKDGDGNKALTGTWNVIVTPDPGGPPPFMAVLTFNSDGNLVGTETDEQVITQGIWKALGGHEFRFTAEQLGFDIFNTFTEEFKIKSTVKLDKPDHFSGRFHVDVIDPNGNLIESGDGSLSADRLKMKP
jgi:hypothetical protein